MTIRLRSQVAGVAGACLIALATAWPGAAEACSCIIIPFDTEYASTSHVFSGLSLGSHPAEAAYPDHHYEVVQVHAVWKGTVTPVMEILVPNTDGMCGFYFTPGTEVLVFAHEFTGSPLFTAACSRNGVYPPGSEIWQQLGPPLTTPAEARTWGSVKAAYKR